MSNDLAHMIQFKVLPNSVIHQLTATKTWFHLYSTVSQNNLQEWCDWARILFSANQSYYWCRKLCFPKQTWSDQAPAEEKLIFSTPTVHLCRRLSRQLPCKYVLPVHVRHTSSSPKVGGGACQKSNYLHFKVPTVFPNNFPAVKVSHSLVLPSVFRFHTEF